MLSGFHGILTRCRRFFRRIFRGKSKKKPEIEKVFLKNEIFFPVIIEYVKAGENVAINARGRSMRPFIEHDRDGIVFSAVDTVKERDVVLAEIAKGHYVCHRVEKIEGRNLTLRGDGNISGTESCTIDDVRAKVIQVIRFGRTWNLETSIFWHYYSIIWPKLLPMRRWLLAINKIVLLHQCPERLKLWRRLRRHRKN